MERFTSILIEHFAGDFPLWLSPVQVSILPLSDDYNDLADNYADQLINEDIRVNLDKRSEQIGAKIRDAETQKIPYMLIIGEKEKANGTVAVRKHKKGNLGSFHFSDFISNLVEEVTSKKLPD
jgi:threonyl-tRNA synthetase